jgi:hypothetical protein
MIEQHVPDLIECCCGVQVYRDRDGIKTNMDGTQHDHTQKAETIDPEREFVLE